MLYKTRITFIYKTLSLQLCTDTFKTFTFNNIAHIVSMRVSVSLLQG